MTFLIANMRDICGNFPSLCVFLLSFLSLVNSAQYDLYSARIQVNFTDPSSGKHVSKQVSARFGVSSPTGMEVGVLVHVLTDEERNHGCTPAVNSPESGQPWIALIQRGHCKFEKKIKAAAEKNASAVVVYNHVDEDTLITMDHSVDHIVSVFIHKEDGDFLANLVDNNVLVTMNISVGEVLTRLTFNENGTLSGHMPTVKNVHLLVISLTFVILLIVGLVCLLVYAVKRSKYMQAKNRAREMIFTVDTSNEGKEARVRLLNSYANQNAALPSVSIDQVPMPLQQQHIHPDQPVV